jgi:glycosyltransferase involved in cell wall biosynthesis
LLLTATSENKFLIKKKYKKSSIYLPENGIVNLKESIIQRTIQLKKGDLCNLLWIGSIDARKALNILIEALSNLKLENWQLNVIGDGSLMTSIQQLAVERHILNKITWHGHIPRNDVFKLLQTSHLHIITSLGEGNPTTIWETMANGIPTITLNHCGMKDVICEKCGVKIDISSYNQVVCDLANVLSDLISNPHKINELSKGVNECARNYTWEKRRELFNQFYQIAIENWQQKRLK